MEASQGMGWYKVTDVLQPEATLSSGEQILLKPKQGPIS
jgi:hypothetical protein